MKIVAAGTNPVQLCRGIETTVAALVKELQGISTDVTDADLANVATVSAGGNETVWCEYPCGVVLPYHCECCMSVRLYASKALPKHHCSATPPRLFLPYAWHHSSVLVQQRSPGLPCAYYRECCACGGRALPVLAGLMVAVVRFGFVFNALCLCGVCSQQPAEYTCISSIAPMHHS